MNINLIGKLQYSPLGAAAGSIVGNPVGVNHYYSLNRQSPNVSFEEAAIKGQAPDKGLYFPEHIPILSKDFIENIRNYSKEELAFKVMKPYTGDSIPDEILHQIVTETVNFDFPLVQVNEDIFSLELFHGPTLAFKDVGARFMSRCLGIFQPQ